jgi:hypothetical protein
MRDAKAMLPVLTLAVCVALPGPARAQSGGTAAGDDRDRGGNAPVQGDAGLEAGSGALVGRRQRVSGAIEGAAPGQTVVVALGDGEGDWRTVAQARTGPDGSFSTVWRADRVGRFTLRATVQSGRRRASGAGRGGLSAPVTVYEAGMATMFGPGLYGGRTACSGVLTPRTVGVAHRTLPCGTRVEVFYGRRRMVVPVVDRGPFVRGVTWDLTSAVARELGFDGRGLVGTMVIGRGA